MAKKHNKIFKRKKEEASAPDPAERNFTISQAVYEYMGPVLRAELQLRDREIGTMSETPLWRQNAPQSHPMDEHVFSTAEISIMGQANPLNMPRDTLPGQVLVVPDTETVGQIIANHPMDEHVFSTAEISIARYASNNSSMPDYIASMQERIAVLEQSVASLQNLLIAHMAEHHSGQPARKLILKRKGGEKA